MDKDGLNVGRRGLIGLASASAACLSLARPALAQGGRPRVLRFGSPLPTNSTYYQAMVIFADTLAKLSNGKLKAELYPAGQLGGLKDMLTAVQLGTQSMLITVPAWFSSFVPQMDVFTLPFMVSSTDRLRTALDGAFGQRMAGYCAAANFQLLGWWITGPRQIVNTLRPIHAPGDLNGMKIRVIASQVYIETFRLLGANPVALDTSEVYLALQQHVVEAMDNPVTDIVTGKFYEVTKYLSATAMVTDFFIAAMNKNLWASLTPAEQGMVTQAMKQASDWQWPAQLKALDEALTKLRGILQYNELTAAERAAFAKATHPVYEKFTGSLGADLISDAIKNLS